jgi:hypothetical protein
VCAQKYEYKFCAFGDVKQDRTKLGKWEGWAIGDTSEESSGGVEYSKMRYSKGQKCYKGPER